MSDARPADQEDHNERILALVAALPEVYQPIYGQPQLQGSRTADSDRIAIVSRIVAEVAGEVGRPLHILDLGSAQGYVAFRLAELGHRVTGIERLRENVAVARAIGLQHPHLTVEFVEGDIVDAPTLVDLGDFDVVLGMSVLHHVIDRVGHDQAVELLTELSARIPHGIFEMALATEPVFWAGSLPDDPRVTLAPYPFIREIGRTGTHLSDVRRPLLFASGTHVLVADGLRTFDSWGDQSHPDATNRGLRRFFMVGTDVLKVAARFSGAADDGVLDVYRNELRNEAHVLEILSALDVDAPRLVEFVDGADESIIVRTSHPGVLLSEVAPSLNDQQRELVTGQVLGALAELESHGLYHTDLRLWNVIWDPESSRARLIDHGAVSARADDVMWPFDAHFSFLVWLVSLWGPFDDQIGVRLPRASRIDQMAHPPAVTALIARLMVHPRDRTVYRDLAAAWSEVGNGTHPTWPVTPVVWLWLAELEQQRIAADEALLYHERAVAAERQGWGEERTSLIAQHEAWQAHREALLEERDSLVRDRDRLSSEQEACRAESAAAMAELERLHATLSWRVTGPLRSLRSKHT